MLAGAVRQMVVRDRARAGRYEVSGELDYGSLGRVRRAHDARLNRDVAILQLDGPPGPELLAGAELAHPNILRVYDAGSDFIVLEAVDRGAAAMGAASMREQLAGALAYAHERGYAHGQLSAGRVVTTADGQPKLVGVGAWHVADAAAMRRDMEDLEALFPRQADAPTVAFTPRVVAPTGVSVPGLPPARWRSAAAAAVALLAGGLLVGRAANASQSSPAPAASAPTVASVSPTVAPSQTSAPPAGPSELTAQPPPQRPAPKPEAKQKDHHGHGE